MTLQRNGTKIARKRLSIDVDLPPCCIRQLAGVPKLLEPLFPDVKEVAEGDGNAPWSLNVDDPGIVVRVQPVEAGTVRRNPNVRRKGCLSPIHVHRHMRMDVRAALLSALTGNVIYRWIRSIGRRLASRYNEVDETGDSQHDHTNDDECRDTFCASGTPPPFFAPLLFLAALFLPRAVTSALLAHTFHFPLVCAFQVSLSIVQYIAGHHDNRLMVVIYGRIDGTFTRQIFQDSLYYHR